MSQSQSTTLLAGLVLFAAGLLSLIFVGSQGDFLGIFPTNTALQISQMVAGAIAVVAAFYIDVARSAAALLAVVVLAVAILGVFTSDLFGLMPIGSWNILLHAVVGVALAFAWLGGSEYQRPVTSR